MQLRAYQRRLERATGYTFRLKIKDRNRASCPAKWTFTYRREQFVDAAYIVLEHMAEPSDADFAWAFAQVGVETIDHKDEYEWNLCRKRYREKYGEDVARNVGLTTSPIVLAAAGKPDTDRFRSQWERRLAAALDRLGIRWDYESDWFYYRDWTGRQRRYIPDFRLVDFANTFVEVKGPSGADAGDQAKMATVQRTYPKLTLLLWDAETIQYIEDLQERADLIGLLRTTRFQEAA